MRGAAIVAGAGTGLEGRIERAGLAGSLSPGLAQAAKLCAALAGLAAGWLAAGVLPARLAPLFPALATAAGWVSVDVVLAHAAAGRRRAVVASLPDLLDLLSAGVSAGLSPGAAIAELSAEPGGPLAEELSLLRAEIEAGAPPRTAFRGLSTRVPAPELADLAAALERSARHGAPLARRLAEQASTIRADRARALRENADRAAPKIQLAVALLLVPSVLLVIVAALISHSDRLLAGV